MKEIHFHVDGKGIYEPYQLLTRYADTEDAIDNGTPYIETTSMAHLSFDLLDQGYRIFVHKNNTIVEFKPGMDNPMNKDIRRAHLILKLFMAGCFDEMFD